MTHYRAQLYGRANELLARLLTAQDRDYRVVLVELATDIVGELRETEPKRRPPTWERALNRHRSVVRVP